MLAGIDVLVLEVRASLLLCCFSFKGKFFLNQEKAPFCVSKPKATLLLGEITRQLMPHTTSGNVSVCGNV
jgi:hypothetical protein